MEASDFEIQLQREIDALNASPTHPQKQELLVSPVSFAKSLENVSAPLKDPHRIGSVSLLNSNSSFGLEKRIEELLMQSADFEEFSAAAIRQRLPNPMELRPIPMPSSSPPTVAPLELKPVVPSLELKPIPPVKPKVLPTVVPTEEFQYFDKEPESEKILMELQKRIELLELEKKQASVRIEKLEKQLFAKEQKDTAAQVTLENSRIQQQIESAKVQVGQLEKEIEEMGEMTKFTVDFSDFKSILNEKDISDIKSEIESKKSEPHWTTSNSRPTSSSIHSKRNATVALRATVATTASNARTVKTVNKPRKMPFVVGQSVTKSHSVTANIQKVYALLKSHNPALCKVCCKKTNVIDENTRNHYETMESSALLQVIQDLKSELNELKREYDFLVSEYKSDSQKGTRLRQVIQSMDAKNEQISILTEIESSAHQRNQKKQTQSSTLSLLKSSQRIQRNLDN